MTATACWSRRKRSVSRRALVHPDVVDQHLLWKDRVVDTAARSPPGAADGKIQNHMERLVIRPGLPTAFFVDVGEVMRVIDEDVDPLRRPFEGVDVKSRVDVIE